MQLVVLGVQIEGQKLPEQRPKIRVRINPDGPIYTCSMTVSSSRPGTPMLTDGTIYLEIHQPGRATVAINIVSELR